MTKFGKGPQYGSFEPGSFSGVQIIEDVTPRTECGKRAEVLFAHPLNRALIVLVLFASIGLMTIFVDRTSVPHNQQTASVSKRANIHASTKVGCIAEVGLKESQLVLYHVAAPWQTLVVLQKWPLPVGLTNFMDQASHTGEISNEVRHALQGHLKEARTVAGTEVLFGSAKILADSNPEVQKAVESGIIDAMVKAGVEYCDGWQTGHCKDNQVDVDWALLKGMDQDLQKWFTNSIANVETWRKSARKNAEALKKEAEELREKAKEGLEKASRSAKQGYEKAKETVQSSTQRMRESRGNRRSNERANEQAERQLEKKLRDAESEFEHLSRKAEKEFEKLERDAEEKLRKAEKELEEIDRKADQKLRRLKERAEAMCKSKCREKAAKAEATKPASPAAPKTRGPVPAPSVVPEPPKADDDDDDDEKPKPLKNKKNAPKKEDVKLDDAPQKAVNDDEPQPVQRRARARNEAEPARKPALAAVKASRLRSVDEDEE